MKLVFRDPFGQSQDFRHCHIKCFLGAFGRGSGIGEDAAFFTQRAERCGDRVTQSATFTNLANMVPIRRDEGVLKRWKGTPLPTWTYVAGFIFSAVIIALVGVIFMLTLGVVAYGLEIDAAKMPAAVVTFLVGVGAFAALGMALSAVVKSASSASAAANAIILPLAFVSNIFIPLEDPPRWIEVVGGIFPLKPFAQAFQDCFNPLVDAPAFDWPALAQIAAWGAFGLLIALTRFTWEPSGSAPRGRRSRRSAAAATTD